MNEAAREDKLDVRDIKLEDDNVNLNNDRTISERLPKECDPLEESNGGNLLELENSLKCDIKIEESVAGKGQCTEKAAPIETAKEKQYKIGNCKQEELEHDINGILGGFLNDNDDDINRNHAHGNEEEMQDFDKNDLVTTGRLSRASDQHDEKETSLEKRQEGKAWQRKQGMYKICNIKQEDLEEDNGIIGGFLDDCDDDSPQNEHDIEKQLLGHFEDHQTQIERTRRIKIEQNLTVNSTTAKPFTEVSSDKQCPPSVKSRPKIFYKRQEMSQNYATDANLERNVLYDASTILHTGRQSSSKFINNHPENTSCFQLHTPHQSIPACYPNQGSREGPHTSTIQNRTDHSLTEDNVNAVMKFEDLMAVLRRFQGAENRGDANSYKDNEASHSAMSIQRSYAKDNNNSEVCEGNEDPSSHDATSNGVQKNRTYSCDICGKQFSRKENLKRHALLHSGERPYSCDICEKNFTTFGACKRHKKRHSQDILFTCDICGKGFKDLSYINKHKMTHLEVKPFSCDVCGRRFSRNENLKKHARLHTGEQPYSCDICEKKFTSVEACRRHNKRHSQVIFFKCDICGKGFKDSSYLNQHKMIHLEVKPFSCDVCGKQFSRNEYLKRHSRLHTGEHLDSCDICEKKFTSSEACRRHNKRHFQEICFTCEICGKGFKDLSYINRHKLTHAENKPFSCDVCGKQFSRKDILKRHVLLHTGEQPYSCDICGKKFTSFEACKRHKKRHCQDRCCTCDICGKGFEDLSYLNKHKMIHSEEKPFSCDVCGKQFCLKPSLKRHARLHTGEHLYSCAICAKMFTSSWACKRHEKRHSQDSV